MTDQIRSSKGKRLLSLKDYKLACCYLAIDITDEEMATLMGDTNPLAGGGVVTIVHGGIGFVKEYASNPRVFHLDANKIPGDRLESEFPHNTKIVIMTDGLPQYHRTWVPTWCSRKNIPYILRKNTQAIYEELKKMLNGTEPEKPTNEEIRETESKGRLNVLLEFIDWNQSNAENARMLQRKANELHIKTTFGSLAQWVAIQRRKKGGVTAVPKSARTTLDISVELLDKMIEDLSGMRDYLISVTEENRLLKTKQEALKKALGEAL